MSMLRAIFCQNFESKGGFGYTITNLLAPTWLSCYTFGEFIQRDGYVQEGKIPHKRQQCLHVIHWLAVVWVQSKEGNLLIKEHWLRVFQSHIHVSLTSLANYEGTV